MKKPKPKIGIFSLIAMLTSAATLVILSVFIWTTKWSTGNVSNELLQLQSEAPTI